jgi:hypothetical protein
MGLPPTRLDASLWKRYRLRILKQTSSNEFRGGPAFRGQWVLSEAILLSPNTLIAADASPRTRSGQSDDRTRESRRSVARREERNAVWDLEDNLNRRFVPKSGMGGERVRIFQCPASAMVERRRARGLIGLAGMAGALGLEPRNAGSKGRCLTNLATPQCFDSTLAARDRRRRRCGEETPLGRSSARRGRARRGGGEGSRIPARPGRPRERSRNPIP